MTESVLQEIKRQVDNMTWHERLDLIAYIAQKGVGDRSFFYR